MVPYCFAPDAAVKDERWRNKLFDFMEKAEARANATPASSTSRGGLAAKRPFNTAASSSSSSSASVSAASGFRPASQLLDGKSKAMSSHASKATAAPALSGAPSVPISADLLEPNLNVRLSPPHSSAAAHGFSWTHHLVLSLHLVLLQNAPDLAVSTRSAALKRLIDTVVNGGTSSSSAASASNSASSSSSSKSTAPIPDEAPISIRAAAAAREVAIARAASSRADYLVRISALLSDVRARGAAAL